MEVGHLLVEWRGATSQLAGPDSGKMGERCHRPVWEERVVAPLHHSSVEGGADNNMLCSAVLVEWLLLKPWCVEMCVMLLLMYWSSVFSSVLLSLREVKWVCMMCLCSCIVWFWDWNDVC